jgi:hypothetical protein
MNAKEFYIVNVAELIMIMPESFALKKNETK